MHVQCCVLFACRYEETREKLQQVNDHRDLEILRGAEVVGLTTSGLADKQSLIAALAPKVSLATVLTCTDSVSCTDINTSLVVQLQELGM